MATSQLEGSSFGRSVVAITSHGPDGTSGVVLSKPMGAYQTLRAGELAGEASWATPTVRHFHGGPVGQRGVLLGGEGVAHPAACGYVGNMRSSLHVTAPALAAKNSTGAPLLKPSGNQHAAASVHGLCASTTGVQAGAQQQMPASAVHDAVPASSLQADAPRTLVPKHCQYWAQSHQLD